MNSSSKNFITAIAAIIVTIAIGVVLAVTLSSKSENNRSEDSPIKSKEEAVQILKKAVDQVSLTENHAIKGTVTFSDTNIIAELPDIDTSFPIVVQPNNKDINVEIFASPEKAGSGVDGWLKEMATNFNKENHDYNGKSIGITLRSISSGTQIDYIKTGVYVPDAFSPSASMWADMLEFEGVEVDVINERMVGNVAGILINKSTSEILKNKYGENFDIKSIISATEEGLITAGYTNPFSSTSGLNFLAATLYSYDESNPLSSAAVEGFNKFQNNIPFVAYNTMQMREAAENSTFSCLILEYQSYFNNSELNNNYEFIPYGIRHDNPLYAISSIPNENKEALKIFNEYCMSNEAQKSATEYGFNYLNDYKDSIPKTNGNTWVQMQKTWKQNKNTSKPIAAVFVLDTSGSMSGEPINALKTSLSNSMKYINSSNYIGVVSFASKVNVDLPIGLFDINQQAYFQGAVSGLNATGSTVTYSALSQAVIMLNEFMETEPNVQPMIFLLSDGEQNGGAKLSSIYSALQYSEIPIYTIGYNANLEELKKVASINEAASIDADSDDVVYKLKNLFNANL